MRIKVEIDLSDAKSIELDSLTQDNKARLYVEYGSGNAYYLISLDELKRLTELGSFTLNYDKERYE